MQIQETLDFRRADDDLGDLRGRTIVDPRPIGVTDVARPEAPVVDRVPAALPSPYVAPRAGIWVCWACDASCSAAWRYTPSAPTSASSSECT